MGQDGRYLALQKLAQGQWSVVRTDQMYGIGFTDREIHGLTHRAMLHRRHKGIYTYATERPVVNGVLLAAQWACGPADAYLTARSALGLLKICTVSLGRIDVAVPRSTVRRRKPPIHLKRATAPLGQSLRVDGPLRFARPPDALLDLSAQGASEKELKQLIAEAVHQQRLNHGAMRDLLKAHHPSHPGIQTLRAAYGRYQPIPAADSGLERSFDVKLAARPHIPKPTPLKFVDAAGVRWQIDRHWSEWKVAVELHGGGFHNAPEDLDKDTFKNAKLALLEIQTIAFTDVRWNHDSDGCLDDLEGLLELRGWDRAAALREVSRAAGSSRGLRSEPSRSGR